MTRLESALLLRKRREIVLVVALCFGYFIFSAIEAIHADFTGLSFNDASLIVTSVLEAILGSVALIILWHCGFPLKRLSTMPTWMGALQGIGLLLLVYCISALVRMLTHGADDDIIRSMLQERASVPIVVITSMINGLYEETFLLGYLMQATERWGTGFAVAASVLVRTSYHVYQGLSGTLTIALIGLLFTLFYLRKRTLWPIVFAHLLLDIIAFTLGGE